MLYFNGKDDLFSLKAMTDEKISLEIGKWNAGEYNWIQNSTNEKGKVSYILPVSKVNSIYTIYDGDKSRNGKSDINGFLKFEVKTNKNVTHLKINSL